MAKRVCRLDELVQDGSRAFAIGGRSVLLCRTAEGVFAVENRCSHQLAPLEGGRLKGFHLFCRKHSARFDLRTGVPNQLAKTPISTFPVSVVDGVIEVDV